MFCDWYFIHSTHDNLVALIRMAFVYLGFIETNKIITRNVNCILHTDLPICHVLHFYQSTFTQSTLLHSFTTSSHVIMEFWNAFLKHSYIAHRKWRVAKWHRVTLIISRFLFFFFFFGFVYFSQFHWLCIKFYGIISHLFFSRYSFHLKNGWKKIGFIGVKRDKVTG